MREPEPLPQAEADTPPVSGHVTTYDRAHLLLYARLLDAVATGVSHDEMIRDLLELDSDSDAATRSLEAHLARARWMRETGYRQMVSEADQGPLSSRR